MCVDERPKNVEKGCQAKALARDPSVVLFYIPLNRLTHGLIENTEEKAAAKRLNRHETYNNNKRRKKVKLIGNKFSVVSFMF